MQNQTLVVPRIDAANKDLEAIANALKNSPQQRIAQVPWPGYENLPQVQFAIAHSDAVIYVRYEVAEKFFRALYTKPNDEVYEDSCVEMFMAFDDTAYYNFEWNAIGACLLGYGSKTARKRLDASVINTIKTISQITHNAMEAYPYKWWFCAAVPASVFIHHAGLPLSGRKVRMNFYKCGDALPEPHYVSWKNIVAPKPDFHLSQFFGEAQFE